MKLNDIKVGETYAVIKRMKWKDREHPDMYVIVIDNDRWFKPTWLSFSSRIGDEKRYAGYEGKSYIIPGGARRVDKYPSDGTKGVLCVRVNDDGVPIGDYAMVVSLSSIRMPKADFDKHAEALRAERTKFEEERRLAQAERENRWRDMDKQLVESGLPSLRAERIGWNGQPRIEWKNHRYDGGWILSDEDILAIIERVKSLEDEVLCYALGDDC